MLLELRDIHAHYGQLEAVKGVSMQIPQGSIVSLLGANGSGKSTIMKSISGLKRITTGEIWFDGQRMDGMPTEERVKLGLAQVLEGKGLFPDMTVLENLKMGAYTRNDKKEVKQDMEAMLERFPILAEKAKKDAKTLSGGQQETLAIARSLMTQPKLLMLDEPLQGLSPLVIGEIESIINDLNEAGMTVLMVEHNVHMALGMADKVHILEFGKIILEGSPKELSEAEYVQKVYLAG
jgi:branched-chain amino acid transport system ATP-binding protein